MLLQHLVHHVLKDAHGSRSGAVVINPSARLVRDLSVAWLCSASVTAYPLTTSASVGTEGDWSGVPDRLPSVGSATWLPNPLVSSWRVQCGKEYGRSPWRCAVGWHLWLEAATKERLLMGSSRIRRNSLSLPW